MAQVKVTAGAVGVGVFVVGLAYVAYRAYKATPSAEEISAAIDITSDTNLAYRAANELAPDGHSLGTALHAWWTNSW